MKKITIALAVSCFAFFIGTHGFEAPNVKATFASQIDFALNLESAMASPESDAAEWAIGLWEFIAGEQGADENTYVYGWAKKMMTNFSDALIGMGYPTCNDFPITGSEIYPQIPTVTINFSAGDKTIPAGTYWNDAGTTYEKKLVADLSGTDFIEIQYNCDAAKPNIYMKYDFSAFESKARILEMYAQHDSATNHVTIELQTVCTETVLESCGTKQTTSMIMNTSDGDEYRIIGTRIEDDTTDAVKRLSVHGKKSTNVVDIHRLDVTDLASTADLDTLTAGVTNDCVDFNEATYIPATGAAACTASSVSADTETPTAGSNAFSNGDLTGATTNAIAISF